ncbi:putative vacuolar protein sorting protein of the Sec1p/Munc-18 family,VpsB [Kockovaella imperatae]|uniref:Putative vacuolar protein sorting protein of the Sec1p/Munc-18 family,VpsB n=1 Tax=Kockovaella imperatae TaxID=4999 RepID=A0A1Y1UNU3_9TREE|nr:putative vacuolar protein sorting protein of the Sec1p/Munc-18 family,VpsB [Kockovaella imperatae]ORX39703.1 putative vacuolar protein sorting protein of the Sec1p/Munc-18 family,VpsB [Kockovaella imperatae]
MDVLKAVQTYLAKMISEVSGMKVLLLDSHTTPIVSLVMTQSDLLSHEIYLTDRIDNIAREPLNHLSCIAFLSSSQATVDWVKKELADPRYGGYWLYFSNTLSKTQIEEMATVDEFESVKEVQEFFADYLAHYPSLFTLTSAALADGGEGPSNPPIYLPPPILAPPPVISNHLQSILAVLLSLKKRPVIRWEKMSQIGRKLAGEVQAAIQQPPYRDLFDFRPTAGPAPLLLILDRRNDPVTPLLSQWTYQAMVHELCGITNGRVKIEQEQKLELRDIVLSTSSDSFFSQHLFANFGDLGAAIAAYVKDYQARNSSIGPASTSRIETIADMKRFVEEYPEFKRLGGNVTKHVTLVGELSRLVERDDLLAVSEVEQSLASQESHQADVKSVLTLISSSKVPAGNKLRLAILYALRYQKYPSNQISQVIDALIVNGVSADRARLVYVMLNFAGADVRQDDLFMNENFFSRGKSAFKGLKGVENVYTQHNPHLSQTLDLLLKGRLRETSYPFLEGDENARSQRPQDIIVFMVGGTTYEESRAVALLNQRLASDPAGPPGGTRILLGGSTVHNSASFLCMVEAAAEHFPPSIYGPPINSSPVPPPPHATSSSAPQSGFNVRAGGYELSVGGAAGSGLYRANPNEVGASFQVPPQAAQVAEGIRDGAGRLWDNVRQKYEERVSRSTTPQGGGR